MNLNDLFFNYCSSIFVFNINIYILKHILLSTQGFLNSDLCFWVQLLFKDGTIDTAGLRKILFLRLLKEKKWRKCQLYYFLKKD